MSTERKGVPCTPLQIEGNAKRPQKMKSHGYTPKSSIFNTHAEDIHPETSLYIPPATLMRNTLPPGRNSGLRKQRHLILTQPEADTTHYELILYHICLTCSEKPPALLLPQQHITAVPHRASPAQTRTSGTVIILGTPQTSRRPLCFFLASHHKLI